MNDKPLLKTPGEMISEAREAQDLTIGQLSERTKIPPPVLSALELDEYHKISGPLYIKSFLRTCATDLGLDPETVLGLYNKISGEQRGGSGGMDMIWEEEKVEVSRIGLPWMQIILVVGIVAVLIGAGLFSLRGCGAEEEEGLQQQEEAVTAGDMPAAVNTAPVEVAVDSASGDEARRESLIPAGKEEELKELADVESQAGTAEDKPVSQARNILADTLAMGWILSPPEPAEEDEVQAKEIVPAVVSDEIQQVEEKSTDESGSDDRVPEEIPVEVTDTESETGESAGTVEIAASPIPATPAQVEDQPQSLPVAEDRIDSSWPLVLRIVCDSPQRIQVRRDGAQEFREVRWPAESETAPEVPSAGFEAGRVYRQGERLVVFWGADDHFSLILSRVRGVEVAVNGRIRDITKLRAGQELILDSHSAGSSPGR